MGDSLMPGVKNSREEIDAGAQDALAEAISNLNAVNGASVAGLLDAYLDAAISSRSNHDWDPQDRIDAAVSSRSSHQWDPDDVIPETGTVARQTDVSSTAATTPDKVTLPKSKGPVSTGVFTSAGATISTDYVLVSGTGVALFEGDVPVSVNVDEVIGESVDADYVVRAFLVSDGDNVQTDSVTASISSGGSKSHSLVIPSPPKVGFETEYSFLVELEVTSYENVADPDFGDMELEMTTTLEATNATNGYEVVLLQ